MTDIESYRAMGRVRRTLVMENEGLAESIVKGGHFGGDYSMAIANRMYSRSNQAAIQDAIDKTVVEQHGDRTWLVRLPIVNVAVFETDDGLVLVDCAYAPGGPALAKAVASISDKPVHTVVMSHFHCDHAFGAWGLFEAGHTPDIVATAEFERELQADIDTWGLNVRYTNQYPADVPREWDAAFSPTHTFHGSTTLTIGGEAFELTHARGETADQLYVWAPERRTLVSADYYQRFLPNAGNGKRRQRHIRDWSRALSDMADLEPVVVLPMHGQAIVDDAECQDRLRAHSAILGGIADQVLDALNSGARRDIAVNQAQLPVEHADRDDVAEVYGTVRDIANMVANEYTGWWDDIPSHWAPASLEAEAAELARLAGGPIRLIERAKELMSSDLPLACQLADWAHLAAPESAEIRRTAVEIYIARIEHESTPTQEALVYLDHLAELTAGIADD